MNELCESANAEPRPYVPCPYEPKGMWEILREVIGKVDWLPPPPTYHEPLREEDKVTVPETVWKVLDSVASFPMAQPPTKGEAGRHYRQKLELVRAMKRIEKLIPIFMASTCSTRDAQQIEFPKIALNEDLAALVALEAGITAMQRRWVFRFDEDNDPKVKWTAFGNRLEKEFHEALPQAGREAGYRFVRAMVPWITGHKAPPLSGVKAFLVRKRVPSKRGRS